MLVSSSAFFFFRKESDSGEEGISIEELKKTTGWELLMKNLNKHFKPKDFDSQWKTMSFSRGHYFLFVFFFLLLLTVAKRFPLILLHFSLFKSIFLSCLE